MVISIFEKPSVVKLMILLKLSRYKSVCETIKQLKLFSCAKCLKKSRTNPEVSLSSEDKTSSIDNILIDGNRLFNNLNKLQRTIKSTRVCPIINIPYRKAITE